MKVRGRVGVCLFLWTGPYKIMYAPHPFPPTLNTTHTYTPPTPKNNKDFDTADALLNAIAANDPEVSPSLIYATAACLEGCSFVNGGSQNTLCGALEELAARHKCYVLGTDFKVRLLGVLGGVWVFFG